LPISWFHQHSLLLFLLILGGCGGDWWSRGVPDPHERSSRVPHPQQKRSRGVPDPQQERGSPLLRFDAARYEYEDRLIMGLIGPKEVSDGKETPLIQPLNFRLPVMPTRPPKFLGPSTLNLTAVVGATVVLPCRVTHLGPASLSWVRLSGASPAASHLTVLSSGSILFSSSPRLALLHHEGSPDWTLQITGVVLRDGGMYECQVNTEPKMSRVVNLAVVEGTGTLGPGPALALKGEQLSPDRRQQQTSILAPRVLAPQPGDTITLECVVTEHQAPPPYFTWYIAGKPLDFSSHRGGLKLEEEFRGRSSASRLTVTHLTLSDSGDFTCSPSGAANATVTVKVAVKKTISFFSSKGDSLRQSSWTLFAVAILTSFK